MDCLFHRNGESARYVCMGVASSCHNERHSRPVENAIIDKSFPEPNEHLDNMDALSTMVSSRKAMATKLGFPRVLGNKMSNVFYRCLSVTSSI